MANIMTIIIEFIEENERISFINHILLYHTEGLKNKISGMKAS